MVTQRCLGVEQSGVKEEYDIQLVSATTTTRMGPKQKRGRSGTHLLTVYR